MPDHLHLLIQSQAESSDCKAFIRLAKQYSAFYYSKAHGGKKKLWQRYGHDHVLRDDENTDDVVRYVVENPVTAGLCARAADYPFSAPREG